MLKIIDKMLGWKCEWKFEKRLIEQHYNESNVYEIYVDTNLNGLKRYKKVLVHKANSAFNQNKTLLEN